LLEYRRACRAQARLLPAQAGSDGLRVGDFAGAEPVDVGRAGPALLGRAGRESLPDRNQREEETEPEAQRTRFVKAASCAGRVFMIASP